MSDSRTKPPLERSTLETYGGAVLGILGAIVTAWWAKSILLACAAGLLIHAVHRSSWTIHWPRWRKVVGAVTVLMVLGLVGGEPILDDFQKQHPAIFSEKSASAQTSVPVPQPVKQIKPEEMRSRMTKYIFSCERPQIDGSRPREESLAEARRWAVIIGDTFGVSIELIDIPNGIRSEITPKTTEASIRMGAVTKITTDVRDTGDGLLVVAELVIPEPYGTLGKLMPIALGEKTSEITNIIEQSIGLQAGKCQML
jgi:hypothetical protein